uniref:NAD(P)-dependent oxidoreductase n=1 Tax=Anaerotignum sp. TaxID=2039241 RepID=UPI0027147975
GFGSIAKNVARRAKGFSMKVLVYDPFITEIPEEFQDFVTLTDLDTLTENSDIISIHVPLTDSTRYLFNKERIMKMKEEAYLINTGRGGIIQEQDLYECMKNGHLGGCAVDVTEHEPIEKGNPLLELENFVVTAHIGMYSIEAISVVSVVCAENVAKVLNGEKPSFVIV